MSDTHPEIERTERFGLPPSEPEIRQCPTCGRMTYAENLRQCYACRAELCPACQEIWIRDYDWHFCNAECAVPKLVEIISAQDSEITELKKKVQP